LTSLLTSFAPNQNAIRLRRMAFAKTPSPYAPLRIRIP
jgi:hypothetical protein